jgi:hypothetical protein
MASRQKFIFPDQPKGLPHLREPVDMDRLGDDRQCDSNSQGKTAKALVSTLAAHHQHQGTKK